MKYALFLLMNLILFLFYWSVLRVVTRKNLAIERQMGRIMSIPMDTSSEVEWRAPFKERVLIPLFKELGERMHRIAPKQMIESDLRIMMSAGFSFDPSVWLSIRILVPIFMVFTGSFLSAYISNPIKGIMIPIIFLFFGLLGPTFYLKRKIQNRKMLINKTLPDILDLLLVSIEAGLGFDSALNKVVEKTKGAVSDEFYRTMQEIKMGKSREEAMRDMSARIQSDDLSSFIGAIIQAEKLGVSISNVLRVQSKDMKTKRKQKAEEKAQKAPIKITMVTLFFIFPAIFIIVIGPMIIQYMTH